MTTDEITTDEYFGGCPECGHTDGFLNCERTHWFICQQHRTKWCAGANLFSSWRDEDEAVWTRNAIRIWHYRNIEPIYPEPTEEEREQKRKRDYERAVADALGATMIAGAPIDPSNPLFDEMDVPFVHRPDRLYILTSGDVAHDLDRAAAFAAFEAHKAGDSEAIDHLLGRA